jgi:hypothetical protein
MTHKIKNTSTNPLLLTITLAISAALSPTMAPSTSFAMEAPSTGESTLNRGKLSLDFQKELTVRGHDLLINICSGEPIDLSQSTLYKDMYAKYDKEFYSSQYSALAKLSPTNALRWWWSSTDETYITKRKNQITGIIAITWALADLATKQNDTFERGSFTIVDPNHALYTFLLSYVKLTTGFEDPQTVPYAYTSCNFAYRRDPILYGSSHHSGRCPQSQFGIDVRFGPTEGVLKLLPYNNTHLLFALLDVEDQQEPLLFMKWEEIGAGSLGAAAYHGFGYHGSQANVSDEARREKDILLSMQQSFENLKLIADLKDDYKTIRSMVLRAENLIEKTRNSMTDCNQAIENLGYTPLTGGNTVESILQQTSEYKSKYHQQIIIQKTAESFLGLVDQIYPNGNNHLRCGNEVILDLYK